MRYSDRYGVCRDCWDEVINTPAYLRICTVKRNVEPVADDRITWRRRTSQAKSPNSSVCGICDWVQHILLKSSGSDSEKDEVELRLKRDDDGLNLSMIGNTFSDTIFPFVSSDSCAASIIRRRGFQTIVDAPAAIAEASKWLRDCPGHPECPSHDASPLPTRVIDVNPEESASSVRILHSAGMIGCYAALSYCWGGSIRGSLSVANIDQYQRRLDVTSLPKSIQDAIHVAQELNIRYLWVDALCIVQDLEEDKQHEIGRMQAVFQNAAVTIVAACSPAAEGGFLQQRSLTPFGRGRVFRIPYMLSSTQVEVVQFTSNDLFEYDETEEVINRV